ncbi:MAG: LysR family transcriptional regulator [Opitutaceae bacterium]|jgi:DNA-binding transcriptional LysR family regulator|nr:LysR family transcriptional regulator [Opitutaceae bacterium]
MEIKYLSCFIAVAEELNFRRAAERLHLSAPALSVQIKALEETLGVKLFERDTRRTRLTTPGEVFLREARTLLRHAKEAMNITRASAEGKTGTLRIGCPGKLGYNFLRSVLDACRQRFPGMDVKMVPLDICLGAHDRALETGEIQIGFAYGRVNMRHPPGIGHFLVVDTPIQVIMSERHPFAARQALSLATVAGHPLVTLAKYPEHEASMRMIFQKRNLAPGEIIPAESFESYIVILATATGISLLPEIHGISGNDGIVSSPLTDRGSDLRLQLHAIWKTAAVTPLVANFIEVLRSLDLPCTPKTTA